MWNPEPGRVRVTPRACRGGGRVYEVSVYDRTLYEGAKPARFGTAEKARDAGLDKLRETHNRPTDRDETTNPGTAMTTINSLDELLAAMKAGDARTLGPHGDFEPDLPTWGDEWDNPPRGVRSYDESRAIVGECSEDLEIVPRSEVGW